MICKFLEFLGTNEIALGVTSLTGLASFALTIVVTIRTAKISRVLKYNEISSRYNRERIGFKKAFEGHRQSIMCDGIRNDTILKSILQNVEEYHAKFSEIFSITERVNLWRFSRLLKKEVSEVDFNKVCNYLAQISGRLAKKEDLRHG